MDLLRNIVILCNTIFVRRDSENHLDSISELESDSADLESNDTSVNSEDLDDEAPITVLPVRRCGYCRQSGHIVTHCDDSLVLQLRREMIQHITNIASIDEMRRWLSPRESKLLQAVMCPYSAIRFNTVYTRANLERIIIHYIQQRQNLTYSIRRNIEINNQSVRQTINRQTNRRIYLHPLETIISFESVLYANLLRTSDLHYFHTNDIYRELSIELLSEPFTSNDENTTCECPICLESIEYIKIQKTNCNHEFCNECMKKALTKTLETRTFATCPLCRTHIKTLSLFAPNGM